MTSIISDTTQTTTITTQALPRLDPPQLAVAIDAPSAGGLPQVRLPSGHVAVHATSYSDVRAILSDNSFGRRETNTPEGPSFLPTIMPQELLLNLDMPDHKRMRGFVTADYAAATIANLAPMIEAKLALRIAHLRAQPHPDLMRDVLEPLTIEVNCAFLGIPESDIDEFRSSAKIVQIASDLDVPGLLDHFWTVYNYIGDLVAGRRPHVPGGLIDRFLTHRGTAEPELTDPELIGLLLGSLLGGDQNVLTVLSKSTYAAVLTRPLWAQLTEPKRGQRLVEELFRLIPLGTISTFPRMTTRDVQLSNGTLFAGDVVYADAYAANRDPGVFDDPHAINPDRNGPRHLQFGYGMHHCMGAALSRLETFTVLHRLACELPDMRLDADADNLRWDDGVLLRRPQSLPVTLS